MSRTMIKYRTSEDCDFGSREVEVHLKNFVDRKASLGEVIDLLVKLDLIRAEDVYEEFKDFDDYELISTRRIHSLP